MTDWAGPGITLSLASFQLSPLSLPWRRNQKIKSKHFLQKTENGLNCKLSVATRGALPPWRLVVTPEVYVYPQLLQNLKMFWNLKTRTCTLVIDKINEYSYVISSLVCVFYFTTSSLFRYDSISSLPSNIDLRPWFYLMMKLPTNHIPTFKWWWGNSDQ
jgi:hypothetical protein